MKLLATADIHLGRLPARLPAERARVWSAVGMWQTLVELAINEQVDAVLAAGDIVDQSEAYFEVIGPLEKGILRLKAAGIPFITVAGNHDVKVLRRLREVLGADSFCVLGAAGTWESRTVNCLDGRQVVVWGRSFTSETSKVSPLPELPPEAGASGLPAIGLLHCDLEQRDSKYCPVRRLELESSPISTWILGHIHKPSPVPAAEDVRQIIYPGSPLAMRPQETGVHGPWLLTAADNGRFRFAQIPLSTVVYDQLNIDLSGAADEDDVRSLLAAQSRKHILNLHDQNESLRVVCLELQVSGQTEVDVKTVQRACAALAEEEADLLGGADIELYIKDLFAIETVPPIDFERLRNMNTPLGVAAALYLQLAQGNELPPETEQFLEGVRVKMEERIYNRKFGILNDAPAAAAEIRKTARRSVLQLIHELHKQNQTGVPQ